MPDVDLLGCRTQPLLSYLKALGVLRHVARRDPEARLGWCADGHAELRSSLDADRLVAFFLDEYEPSAITSPWNGGSGYYPGDSSEAIEAIGHSESPRFATLRETISAARAMVGEREKVTDKTALLDSWRASCPEAALSWLDAAVVLATDGPEMNPVLGTGGNDGRLEFSNNFLARLLDCLPHVVGRPGRDRSQARLEAALFGRTASLVRAAIGMFHPGLAGLPNSSSSTVGEEAFVNPWDFVLGLEGAILFAGGPARRLSVERAVFPFTVRTPVRVGVGLESQADADSRGEVWLPIWKKPSRVGAVARLFSEGRLQDGFRQAREGRDVFRAVAGLGVDRGIIAFERVVYMKRFGKSYVAVPAGRLDVKRVRSIDLVRVADPWLDNVRRMRIDSGSVREAVARVDRALVDLAAAEEERAALERWLLALADVQLAVGRRPASRAAGTTTYVRPLAGLRGLVTALPLDAEHRLARALATVGREPGGQTFRAFVEPVKPTRGNTFDWSSDRPPTGVPLRRPEDILLAFASAAAPAIRLTPSVYRARLRDVAAFLVGDLDPARIVRLAYALSLCRSTPQPERSGASSVPALDRLYALVGLAVGHSVVCRPGGVERELRSAPEILGALRGGQAHRAAQAAVRRLESDGLAPYHSLLELARTSDEARRVGASLAFPLYENDRAVLEALVLEPEPLPEIVKTAMEGVTA